MNNRDQVLTITVVGLIALTAINFGGDWLFRGQQIEINGNFVEINRGFITMHNNTNTITGALSVVVMDLNEKMEKVLDELFDRIWEDLAQT